MPDPAPLVLKWEDWPQADQTAWGALFAHCDMFDEAGLCQNWSDGSRSKRAQGYGQWLSFLRRTAPEALGLKPEDRIAQERVRAYLEECDARLRPQSTAGLISDLYVVAVSFLPQRDWTWLKTVATRLINRANRHSLPAPHPITAGEIFQWSRSRMADVDGNDDLRRLRRAIQFRQALMIGFLIARPVRRRAVLGMRLGKHLAPTSDGFEIVFVADDMKDRKARSFQLPAKLVQPMRRYLDRHRPILLQAKSSDGLWINQYGNPITADGYSRELPKITERHLGIALRPHAFRHIAATSIAESDPEHVNIIRDLLGHATLEMSEKHYNRATGISSCNGLQSIVEDIRKTVPIMGRAKRVLTPPGDVRDDD